MDSVSATGERPFPHFSLAPGWSFQTGEGLDPTGRRVWHDQLALLAVTAELAREPAWWDHWSQVRAGAAAHDVAKPYGTRGRRELIAALLELAGEEETQPAAEIRLDNAGVCAWTVDEDATCYLNRDDFLACVLEGARFIARRGASKCLACGVPVAQDAVILRAVRRDYCSAHEHDDRRLKSSREKQTEHTFAAASRAMARAAS